MSRRMIWLQILILLVLAALLIVVFIGILRYELDAKGHMSIESNGTQFLPTTIYPMDANATQTSESPANVFITKQDVSLTTETQKSSPSATLEKNFTESIILSQTLSTSTSGNVKRLYKENVTGKAKSGRTTTRGISPAHSAILADEYEPLDEMNQGITKFNQENSESELDEAPQKESNEKTNSSTESKPETVEFPSSDITERNNPDFEEEQTEIPVSADLILSRDVAITTLESLLNQQSQKSLNVSHMEPEIPVHVQNLAKMLDLGKSDLESVEDTYSEELTPESDYTISDTTSSTPISQLEPEHETPEFSNLNRQELKILDSGEDLGKLPAVENSDDALEIAEDTDTISEEQTTESDYSIENLTSQKSIASLGSTLELEMPEYSNLNTTDDKSIDAGVTITNNNMTDSINSTEKIKRDKSPIELPVDKDFSFPKNIIQKQSMPELLDAVVHEGQQLTKPQGFQNITSSNQTILPEAGLPISDSNSDEPESDTVISESISHSSESDPSKSQAVSDDISDQIKSGPVSLISESGATNSAEISGTPESGPINSEEILDTPESDTPSRKSKSGTIKSEEVSQTSESEARKPEAVLEDVSESDTIKSEATPLSSESESISEISESGQIKSEAVPTDTLESDSINSDLSFSAEKFENSTYLSDSAKSETVTTLSSEEQLPEPKTIDSIASLPVPIPNTYFVYHFTPNFHFQEYYPITEQISVVPLLVVPQSAVQQPVVPQTVTPTHSGLVVTKSFYHYRGKSNYHWVLENSDGSSWTEQKNFENTENKMELPFQVPGGMYNSFQGTDGKIYATHYSWYRPYLNFGGQSSSTSY